MKKIDENVSFSVTTHAAVASQIRKIYDHTYRKYSSQMHGLADLRKHKKIDRFTYIGTSEKAFEEFEERFEKEIAPLLKLLSIAFIAIFLSLQVMGDNQILRIRTSARARSARSARTGRDGRHDYLSEIC